MAAATERRHAFTKQKRSLATIPGQTIFSLELLAQTVPKTPSLRAKQNKAKATTAIPKQTARMAAFNVASNRGDSRDGSRCSATDTQKGLLLKSLVETLAWHRPKLFGPPTAEFPHNLADPEARISGLVNCCLAAHPLAMAGTWMDIHRFNTQWGNTEMLHLANGGTVFPAAIEGATMVAKGNPMASRVVVDARGNAGNLIRDQRADPHYYPPYVEYFAMINTSMKKPTGDESDEYAPFLAQLLTVLKACIQRLARSENVLVHCVFKILHI